MLNQAQIDSLTEEAVKHISMVPEHLRSACVAWVRSGRIPGHFLQAVICDELNHAISRADRESLAGIVGLCQWFYNYAPGECWGSPSKMDAWADAADARRTPTQPD